MTRFEGFMLGWSFGSVVTSQLVGIYYAFKSWLTLRRERKAYAVRVTALQALNEAQWAEYGKNLRGLNAVTSEDA